MENKTNYHTENLKFFGDGFDKELWSHIAERMDEEPEKYRSIVKNKHFKEMKEVHNIILNLATLMDYAAEKIYSDDDEILLMEKQTKELLREIEKQIGEMKDERI